MYKSQQKENNTINKIRGSIIESNAEIIKDNKNILLNKSINNIKISGSKIKSKKKKKINMAKNIKNTESKVKKQNPKINVFLSQKKAIYIQKRPNLKEKERSYSSSSLSSSSDSNSQNNNNNNENKSENKKIKNKNMEKRQSKFINKNNKNDIDNESSFKSSCFSDDSKSNDNEANLNKNMDKNVKSSKNIEYPINKKLNDNKNEKKKKISNKKANIKENVEGEIKKNNKLIIKKKESTILNKESKDSSNFIKNNLDKNSSNSNSLKVESFNLENRNDSQNKLKRLSNKKKDIHMPYQISRRVNNIFIFPKEKNNNIYESHNQNMNIISPGNIISIEYNINHGKKNERNMGINNNHIIINNNESNNITYFKKDIHVKNDDMDTQNNFPQRIKEINEDKTNKNTQINQMSIDKKNNTKKSEKKSKKKFLFCCL
jgi:hypothetical protein